MGNVGKTGDGIRMAWEAGAGEEGMERSRAVPRRPGRTGVRSQTPVEYAAVQPDLWVDSEGRGSVTRP